MSDKAASYWVKLVERIIGVVILILGVLLIYFTVTSIDNLGVFSWLFGALSAVLLIVGIFILIVKLPE